MRVRIHRGSQEIGGTCIEVAAVGGDRILLDLGRPLSAGFDDEVELPDIPGLREPDPQLLGVLISHPHLDHYGLVAQLPTHVDVYAGKEAAALVSAAAFFSPGVASLEIAGHFSHAEPMTIGAFTVTPYLNDHSAFDAYSLLIEADGRRLFYTGDIRGHGRKAALFEQLLRQPPADVDVMLMEGTHVRATGSHDVAPLETESELEDRFVALAKKTAGAVAVFGSAQNLDRLVTVYRAAVRSGRLLAVDLYGATVAAATRATIPQPGHDALRVYVPQRQRVRVKQAGEFWRVEAVRDVRVFGEAMAAEPGKWMLHVPSSTAAELVRDGLLDSDGVAVWSLWDGYLKEPSGVRLHEMLDEAGVPLAHLHTSGHAGIADLQRLVASINADRVVPVHSEAPQRFAEVFQRVECHNDGEWWDV